jgi:hypothetical protein
MKVMPHALSLAAAAAATAILSVGTLPQAAAQTVPHPHARGHVRTYQPPAAYQDYPGYGYSYGGYPYGGYGDRGGCSDSPAEC